MQPAAFAAATEEYRAEADVVGRFLEDECVVTGEDEDFIPRGEAYDAYRSWARDSGEPVVNTRTFAGKLREAGVFIDPKVAHVYDENDRRVPLRYYRRIRFRFLDEHRDGPGSVLGGGSLDHVIRESLPWDAGSRGLSEKT